MNATENETNLTETFDSMKSAGAASYDDDAFPEYVATAQELRMPVSICFEGVRWISRHMNLPVADVGFERMKCVGSGCIL
jgi:hypothetical protein